MLTLRLTIRTVRSLLITLGFVDDSKHVKDPFSLHRWPCESDAAKKALLKMILARSHDPRPIPAFDVNDELILPLKYREALQGAIVHVKATICHQYLAQNKSDNFYADVQEINVIRPPESATETPSKRKLAEALDGYRRSKKQKGATLGPGPQMASTSKVLPKKQLQRK